MGLGLSHPVTSKVLYRKGNQKFRVGAASMHGWRDTMEDAHTINLSLDNHKNSAFFGIFDGHSGSLCSKYISQNLPKKIDEKVTDFKDEKLIKEIVMEADQDFLDADEFRNKDDGSAGIFTLASFNDNNTYTLVNGNIGDSRIVLFKKTQDGHEIIACTQDHKPTNEAERKRIEAAGGSVQMARVDGQLALSRAFGDRMLKHPMSLPPADRKVTSDPDMHIIDVTSDDYLFLACDGIYEGDVFTRESVMKFISDNLEKTNDLAVVCANVLDECLRRGSRDNMSAMIVQFVNGEDYHSDKNEYVPGTWHAEEGDSRFQEAYRKDASDSGYTLEQALELLKKRTEKAAGSD